MKTQHTLILALIATLLGGCSSNPPSYSIVKSYEVFQTPGEYISPPRTDIVLGWDNSGSMASRETQYKQMFRQFLADLDQQLLYYRFIVVPLVPTIDIPCCGTSNQANIDAVKLAVAPSVLTFNQVAANHFDKNWGADWVKEELTSDGSDALDPDFFKKPAEYSQFPATSPVAASVEPGLLMISQYLKRQDVQDKFLRNNAQLATIVVSNGDDTSETNGLGTHVVEDIGADILKEYTDLKAPGEARLFSIVNPGGYAPGTCMNSNFKAKRYINAALALLGQSYSICNETSAFASALAQIKSKLLTTSAIYTQSYLFLPREPKPESIRVFKKTGSTRVELQKDETGVDGWKYLGMGTFPVVTAPIVGPVKTGFTIELYGSAQMVGTNEHAEVEYDPTIPM